MAEEEYTRDQYERGIGRALKAGDMEAAQYLIQKARHLVTGEAFLSEKLGAGMQNVVTGVKQLFGQAKPGEAAEQMQLAKEADPSGYVSGAGTALALAPLALLTPATVPGAIVGGALSGLAMPTDNPDVLKGKLIEGGIGAATGGVLQKGMQMLPRALSAARDQIAQRTPFFPGARQEIAERAFVGAIPQGERSAVEGTLASYAPPNKLPGFQQTTGAASRNPTILAGERHLREAGGAMGQPLRDMTEDQAQAVASAWRQEFGGQAAPAAAAREAFAQATTPGLVLKRALGKPGDFDPVQQVIQNAKQQAVGPELKAIEAVEQQFYDALTKAANSGDITALHKFRRFGINDVLSGMYREGAPQSAVAARGVLQDVKSALDSELDRLLQGQNRFSNFMQGYRDRSLALSQAQAGEKMLGKLEARPPTAAGTPQPGGIVQDIRNQEARNFQNPRFKTPEYTPSGQDLLSTTAREVEQAGAWRSPTVGPTGTATAANLAPMESVLQRARQAQAQQLAGPTVTQGLSAGAGAVAALAGHLPGLAGLAGLAAHYGLGPARVNALNDTARRMVGYYTNPQQALDAIIRSGLPAAEQHYLTQAAQALIAQSGAATAAASAPAMLSGSQSLLGAR
jgi:hypothetical protein